jgi:hypothetical protein
MFATSAARLSFLLDTMPLAFVLCFIVCKEPPYLFHSPSFFFSHYEFLNLPFVYSEQAVSILVCRLFRRKRWKNSAGFVSGGLGCRAGKARKEVSVSRTLSRGRGNHGEEELHNTHFRTH